MKFNNNYLKSRAFKRDAMLLGGLIILWVLLNFTGLLG